MNRLYSERTNAGAINSPSFSLWSDNILFGGVDRSKYNDTLQTFPIVDVSHLLKAFRINMDGLLVNGSSQASDTFPLDAHIDTSWFVTYVLKSVAQALWAHLGNVYAPDKWGRVNFTCSSVSESVTIGFKFGNLNLEFYLHKFIAYDKNVTILYDDPSPRVTFDDIGDTCWLTIWESRLEKKELSGERSIILGTNVMSLTYSVFDFQNDEVSLAKRNWDDSPSDIIEITKDGVPGAKRNGTNKTGAKKNAATSTCVGGELGMVVLVAAIILIMGF
ncbi:unnamed protein product [Penicillium pancosmium]